MELGQDQAGMSSASILGGRMAFRTPFSTFAMPGSSSLDCSSVILNMSLVFEAEMM